VRGGSPGRGGNGGLSVVRSFPGWTAGATSAFRQLLSIDDSTSHLRPINHLGDRNMAQTNQEIWAETVRTAELLLETESSVQPMVGAATGTAKLDESCLPVSYVSDAMILTRLVLSLRDRGVRVS